MIVLFLAKSFIFLMCKKVDFGQKKTVCKYLQKLQPKRYYGAQTKTKLICNCHKKGDNRGLVSIQVRILWTPSEKDLTISFRDVFRKLTSIRKVNGFLPLSYTNKHLWCLQNYSSSNIFLSHHVNIASERVK